MLQGFGWPHLLIILLVVIVLFGAKRLPDAARGVGKSLRIFKSEAKAMRDEGDHKDTAETQESADKPAAVAPPQQLPQASSQNGATATPAASQEQRQNDVQA